MSLSINTARSLSMSLLMIFIYENKEKFKYILMQAYKFEYSWCLNMHTISSQCRNINRSLITNTGNYNYDSKYDYKQEYKQEFEDE